MNIRDYAALSHNRADWTEAFSAAISDLRRQGGGVLTVPPGDYLTAPIQLCGHMTFDIQSGATIRFLRDEAAFPKIPLEFEGIPKILPQPCIYAEDEEEIVITGGGTIDGQGGYWWRFIRKGDAKHIRPYLVCFNRCRHITLENVTLTNSPCWTVHPLRCQDVVIRGLRINNPADSPNTDGIDPNACQDVRIHDCTIDVGDDCIAIKSGTEDTPDRQPCERIIISNCHLLHGHGGVVLGSEMSGGIRNVLVSNCIFYETDRGVRLKTRRGRGGVVEGLRLTNLIMERVMCPFVFNMYYFCGERGNEKRVWDKAPYPVDESTPALRDVSITGVLARGCTACAGFFYGLSEMPVERVIMRDVLVEMEKDGKADCPAMMDGCPKMQGAGLFLRNARDVDLRGVKVVHVRGEELDVDESVTLIS
ncbi:MAG: glycoside hydrolase family 28 protein [Christensenellaceae bacterium]|nr:glycoside hydrolase family 28 protein [Christensenellaceae bacterium]